MDRNISNMFQINAAISRGLLGVNTKMAEMREQATGQNATLKDMIRDVNSTIRNSLHNVDVEVGMFFISCHLDFMLNTSLQ